VSLVDVRARAIAIEVRIPSQSPADEFRIRVMFQCQVTDPEVVVRDGLLDVSGPLFHHVKRDRELEGLGVQYHVDDINEVREEVTARLRAYCTLHPPRLRGMDAKLLTVDVATPTALVHHATQLRDKEWQHIRDTLSVGFEMEKAEKLADLIRSGPEALEGLAIARGETSAGLAADRAYDREKEMQHSITELLSILQKDGHLDRLNVDVDILVQAFTDSIRPRRSESAPRIESRSRRESARSITAAGDDELVLDEDELNDE
jgi:hypothetical protein